MKTATSTKHRVRTFIATAVLVGAALAGTSEVASAAQGDSLVHIEAADDLNVYRASDSKVYLRNSNTPGIADIEFFFGDPGDVPLTER